MKTSLTSRVLAWVAWMTLMKHGACWGDFSPIKSFFEPITCRFRGECCNDHYIKLDEQALKKSLDKQVYGQHLAKAAILKHFHAQARPVYQTKALSLSFHGGTGTGKNLVSSIIAESIYRKGMESKFVHLIAATNEFPHPDKVHEYKVILKKKIEASVSMCERSMFIFDEVDKMPAGVLDIVKPYLDFYETLNNINYRKSTFIFLSNTAGHAIQKRSIGHWRDGRDREELQLVDMEQLIITEAFNEKNSGMWQSSILLHQMVSAHIPFLPLERRHVRECVKDSLFAKQYYPHRDAIDDRDVRDITDQLSYYPEEEQLFSVTGCKRVPDKVDFIMAYDRYNKYKH